MGTATKTLPFEYTQRWEEVGGLFTPKVPGDARHLLNKRDRDLEDYLATLGGDCACARAWADSGSTTLTLTASTSVSAGADMTTINESEGGTFAISGSAVTGPAGLYWYSVAARFTHSSGADDVNCGVQANVAAANFTPAGWDTFPCVSGWTELPFRPTYTLARPTAGSRVMVASCSLYLWRMCECTPTPGGGG